VLPLPGGLSTGLPVAVVVLADAMRLWIVAVAVDLRASDDCPGCLVVRAADGG